MSMLAGPRRKQKVVNLRGGNKEWSEDTSKFGQRMLERMGWAPGKGLGAREDGVVQHVVARYKCDERGLGYEERADQWTQHEDQFSRLLADLHSNTTAQTDSNGEDKEEVVPFSGVSLEKKSKKSRARVHYHKFTRGKDLSRYSEKDIANILGKKSLRENKKTEVDDKKSEAEETGEESGDVGESEGKQLFTTGGNMLHYFTNKLKTFNKQNNVNEEEMVPPSIADTPTNKIKKKKKPRHNNEADNATFTQEEPQSTATSAIEQNASQKKRSKKKKNQQLTSHHEAEVCSSGDSNKLLDDNEIIENDEPPTKKKKKKRSH